jgi:uncharacterized protein (TIGR04255 family)
MLHTYKHPPLRELTAEFRFRPGEPWDPTIPGLLYEQLRGSYPNKRQGRRVEVQTRVVDGQLVPLVRGQSGDLQFISEDGLAGVRIDVDQLAYQRLRPYPGWPEAADRIRRALQSYIEIAGPVAFEQLRLRFVNRIDLDRSSPSLDVAQWLTIGPKVPAGLASSFGGFLVKVDMPEPQRRGHLVISTGIAESSQGETSVGLVLELDFLSSDPPLGLDDADAWLDGAHGRILDAFELCITDEARRAFQGSRSR